MSDERPDVDVLVIGAGAAGLMCAATAGRRGRRVRVLDHWRKVGERIRISGGGRCNFTNRSVDASNFVSRNPHFCRSALARWTPTEMISLLDRHRVAYEERESGQFFCSRAAADVTRVLLDECTSGGVIVDTGVHLESVNRLSPTSADRARFVVLSSAGRLSAESLVVATGGLAVPKLGATPLGYRLAEQFGHGVVEPRPGLVPFALRQPDRDRLSGLTGVSVEATVSCASPDAPTFTGSVLFTHAGLSGPAILQISNYWSAAAPGLTLDLLPGADALDWLQHERSRGASFGAALARRIPKRLAQVLVTALACDKPVSQLTRAEVQAVVSTLKRWPVTPNGTLGFEKAEVTVGGVDTSALSSKTMESQLVPGLFFAGEVVDVTGWLGGYNFQWAWSSGYAAGLAA